MTIFFQTTIAEVGPDVAELLEGGVLILYAVGAPPELAEVSALHEVLEAPSPDTPPVGSLVTIGSCSMALTAVGARAWTQVAEIGHVVINFNGAHRTDRAGELCAEPTDPAVLKQALVVGSIVTIAAAQGVITAAKVKA